MKGAATAATESIRRGLSIAAAGVAAAERVRLGVDDMGSGIELI